MICKICKHSIHEKCYDSNYGCILNDPATDPSVFFCESCSKNVSDISSGPDQSLVSNSSLDIGKLCSNNSFISDSDTSFVSAHDSDFEWVTDSDSESDIRGLNFKSLPNQGVSSRSIPKEIKSLPVTRVVHLKYPCTHCHLSVRKNQDSICCTLCDQ